jgi:hypothetical protein
MNNNIISHENLGFEIRTRGKNQSLYVLYENGKETVFFWLKNDLRLSFVAGGIERFSMSMIDFMDDLTMNSDLKVKFIHDLILPITQIADIDDFLEYSIVIESPQELEETKKYLENELKQVENAISELATKQKTLNDQINRVAYSKKRLEEIITLNKHLNGN